MNTKKQNNRQGRKPQRERFNAVTFKTTTTDFESGLDQLRTIDSINKVFSSHEESEECVVNTTELAKEAIISDLYSNIPEYNNKETRYYALNISAYKVSYKLGNNIAFGWQLTYDRETKESTYELMVVVTSKEALEEVEPKLTNWTKTEKAPK